jgi:hypothetical protein
VQKENIETRGDRGYMGQGLDGTSQFSACSRIIVFIIFIPYMGINITHTEKNFHRNCTSSLLVMSENKFFLGAEKTRKMFKLK